MNIKIKFGVIAAVFLFLIFAAYLYYAPIIKKNNEEKNFILEKEVQLSDNDKKTYEDRLNNAEQLLTNATNDEEKLNALMMKGFNLQALGRLNDAKLAFEAASKLKQDDFSPHKALFDIKVEMNDLDGARQSARKSIELAPHIADTWVRYIEFENFKMQTSNDSIGFLYIEALSKTNNHPDIVTNYARYLESIGNLQAAKEYWIKAGEINPPRAALYANEVARLDTLLNQQQ